MKQNKPIKKPTQFITDLTQITESNFYKNYNRNVAINYVQHIYLSKLQENS